ncbi:MAG: GNAT family N-acetyltransferase [Butyrivibrio sp.]|nr:GNAT family N-acetyltransferase [Butyrivibrio sp.]
MNNSEFEMVGEKVSLRLITSDDTDLIVKWRNNDRIRNNFVYREFFTREIHENWLKTKVDTGNVVQLIICENSRENIPVGSVYFRYEDDNRKNAEYGIFIGEDDAVGKGYGNETANLAVEYARNKLGLDKLMLRVFSYNKIAQKSYEQAGFSKSGKLPMVVCSDGQKSDMILMELVL